MLAGMSTERLHLNGMHALQLLRRLPLGELLATFVEMLRRSSDALRRRGIEPDTSIAWEDGEIHDDREVRG